MLIDKLIRLLYREVPGKKDTYMIVYPKIYLDDIYTDFSLTEKTSVEVLRLANSIQNIRETINEGMAPVTSICGKTGEVKLLRSCLLSTSAAAAE